MAKRLVECARCHRLRYEDRMYQGKCVHGVYWLCIAKTSCKNFAREERRQRIREGT